MKPFVIALGSIFTATFLLEVGGSLLGVLQPIRGLLEGFPGYSIGGLGSAYYLGFILGCLYIPRLIKRFGHIRAFAACAAITGSAALLNAFLINEVAWIILRVVFGFCMSGLYTIIESWLNELATRKTRGQILAGYMVTVWFAVLSGKLIFAALDPTTILPFAIVSILISLSLVPVALTTSIEPEHRDAVPFRPRDVYEAAPIGFVTCFLVGMINGALWGLAPVYAQAQTQSTSTVGFFMAALVLGGALAQWPIGKLSDNVDRRRVILASSLAAVVFGIGLAVIHQTSAFTLYWLAFGFGAAALPLYSLSIAHVNDKMNADVFVEVSGQLLLVMALGAIIGPLLASVCIDMAGNQALFGYTAAVHGIIAVYTIWRLAQVESVPREEQVPYSAVPETTPLVFEMQPTSAPENRTSEVKH